jgi:hypothetical protein
MDHNITRIIQECNLLEFEIMRLDCKSQKYSCHRDLLVQQSNNLGFFSKENQSQRQLLFTYKGKKARIVIKFILKIL